MTVTNEQKHDMIEIKPDDFQQAIEIIDSIRNSLAHEIQEKHGLLLMAPGYEDLNTALGLLCGDLLVTEQATRSRIKQAYAHASAPLGNIIENSPAQDACFQMQAALFTILNMRCPPGAGTKPLENALAAANFGSELAAGLLDAGPDVLSDCYLSPSGQILDQDRLEFLKATFDMLQPSTDPNTKNPEGG